MELDSVPPGADARTSQGQSCKTPCSVAVPAAEGFSVSYTLANYQPLTVPVQVPHQPGDLTSPAATTVDPNPVVGELQPVTPPKPVRKKPRKPRAPKATAAPATAAPAASPFPDPAATPEPAPYHLFLTHCSKAKPHALRIVWQLQRAYITRQIRRTPLRQGKLNDRLFCPHRGFELT